MSKAQEKQAVSMKQNPERLGFKTFFGTTTMASTEGITAALMTSWFMVYLTDYAGIGKWAAALGSVLLLAVRIFDAVNDPFQGWVMDRAKIGKYGKFKPFIILSIILMAVGVASLFFIPTSLTNSPVAIIIWVFFFYLLYDIGASFYAPNLIYRTLTLDSVQRGKLMIGPRLLSMLLGIVTSALIAIVSGVNGNFNNMHTSFGVTVLALVGGAAIISLFGISRIKEKYHAPVDEKTARVKLSDIFVLIRENKALRVTISAQVFSGFIWTFLFATMIYYIKWAYCADLTTGAVNTELYGMYSLIGSMLMFIPLIVGTIIATPILKKIGSPIKMNRILVIMEAGACGILFVFQILGLLQQVPILFFLCMAVSALAIGCGFIPGETMNIECMDYEIYKNGKDRSALCNACNKFINKAQSAVSAGIVGILLTSIGYVVDSATDTYMGDLAAIPIMLTWFIVIMGLIPCILGVVAWLILKHYPVTDEVRAEMKQALSK
jgi:Na+/melibiose symporter-like transporter